MHEEKYERTEKLDTSDEFNDSDMIVEEEIHEVIHLDSDPNSAYSGKENRSSSNSFANHVQPS